METEFEPQTENLALKADIIDRIARSGPISFREFMETALYHPTLGYYTSSRDKIGRTGDYLTSPEVSPVFGAMIGRQLRECWEVMGSPATFDVVETGAGSGTMARDILAWARRTAPNFSEALRYAIVEVSEALQLAQRRRLATEGFDASVRWRASLPAQIDGCIISNELLDAMPVHRVFVHNGKIMEVHVGWDGAAFVEEFREPGPKVISYFESIGMLPGEGCLAEVNLDAPGWIAAAAGSLERGFVITLDYGYEADELYAPWRADGTLLCFYRHNPGTDPYVRIGRQDMTAHVDFTSVRRAGEAAGLTTLGLVSQSSALANLGIAEALRLPEGSADMEEHFARRHAVMDLLDPAGLGRIKWLVQAKGVEGPRLTCLRQPD